MSWCHVKTSEGDFEQLSEKAADNLVMLEETVKNCFMIASAEAF